MKRCFILLAAAIVFAAQVGDVWARGGGRPGGGGGGGGGRPSVGGGGGGARPSVGGGGARPSLGGAAAHTPSLSRPQGKPVASRPSLPSKPNLPNVGGGNKPNLPNVGGGGNKPNLPNVGGGNKPNLPNVGGGDRPGIAGNRPNIGGNRPNDGAFSRPSQGQLNDFLGLHGGGNDRPGLADRPNLPDRPGAGTRPNLPDRPNIGDNRLNIGGNVNIGNQVTINRQNNVNNIRNNWANVNNRPFDNNYWGRYPGVPGWRWQAGWGRYPGYWGWRAATWVGFGTWFPWRWAEPIPYDYGTNVVYQDNSVYVNGQQYATSADYYQQAETIAQNVPQDADPEKVEWMPLGVFAIAEQDATDTGMLLQLAVSKEGIVAGTFYNQTLNVDRPVEGTVDQKSQRAAWHFVDGKNPEIVMETGVVNLTKDETTALVHFGPDKSQTWLMVRLPEPEAAK